MKSRNIELRKKPKTIYSYYVTFKKCGLYDNGYKTIEYESDSLDDVREYARKNVAWIMKNYDARRPGFDFFPIRYLSFAMYDERCKLIRYSSFFEPDWTDYELFDRPEYGLEIWRIQ